MKKCILFILLNVIVFGLYAQNNVELERQADEWAQKSFMQTKALSAYLACFKQTQEKEAQMRIIDKTISVVESRGHLMDKNAVVVDSLIDEARARYGHDKNHYLPLLEQRIIHSSNSSEKYAKEFSLYDEALSMREANGMLSGEDYEQLLRWYVSKLIYKKDLPREDKLKAYANLWSVYRENSPGLDSLDIKLLNDYALECSLGKDPQTSADLHELKKQYIEKTKGKNSEEYIKILQSLYIDYSNIYKAHNPHGVFRMTPEIEKEIAYRLEFLQHQKSDGIEIKVDDVRSTVFTLTAYKNDTLTARNLAVDFASMIEQKYGKESREYCKALDLIVDTYDRDDANVIPLLRELLALQEKVLGKDDLSYESTYSSLSFALSRNHQMQEAIDMQTSATKKDNYTDLLLLSTNQSQYGQYREAIGTYEKMMEYCAAYPQERGLHLMGAALGSVNCYVKLKDINGMLAFGNKWCNDNRFTLEEQSFIFSQVVAMAGLNGNANYDVIRFIDNYVISHPSAVSTAVKRAEVMEQKAIVYMGMKELVQSEKVLRQIINSLRQESPNSLLIIKYEQYLEICLMAQERWDEALELNQNLMSEMSQLPGYDKYIECIALYYRAAIYQDQKDNFDEVLMLCERIDNYDIQQAKSLFSNNVYSINTFTLMTTILPLDASSVEKPRYRALCKKGMKDTAEKRMNMDAVKKESLLKFSLSRMDNSIQNGTTTWTSQFNDIINNVTVFTMSDSLAIKLFDYTLLYKQAFLTAESSMRQQLLESGNESVKAKFKELQDLRMTIQQYESAGLPVKELVERSVQLDKQLVEDSKMYGDFTKSLNLTWVDIRESLKPGDMAVEFLSYVSFDDDKEHIAALLLRSDWKVPKVLPLFSAEQIPNGIYSNGSFSKMCWEPILRYSKGIKNIFFAPAGVLYNIGLESMLAPDEQEYLSNKYNLYRISSTRELALLDKTSNEKLISAVVYGGIDFNATTTEMVNDAKQYHQTSSTRSSDSLVFNLRTALNTIPYLPGSKKEADTIADIIRVQGGGMKTNLLTGTAGTETSFKSLSGQINNIIHVSTHGFYHVIDSKKQNYSRFFVNQQDTEDKVLTRTGLLFAGVNNTMLGDSIPDGVDDGILTAQEISALDLKGLQLVVLSACQTAQGDIMSDGVFGLQRGFKKAGANSILMSLWKVDDAATCLLMTEFYKNWIGKGKTKHDALESAKRTVRSHTEKGWDDPKYWAAFILLDGLDQTR